jgi:hypothetical protein
MMMLVFGILYYRFRYSATIPVEDHDYSILSADLDSTVSAPSAHQLPRFMLRADRHYCGQLVCGARIL